MMMRMLLTDVDDASDDKWMKFRCAAHGAAAETKTVSIHPRCVTTSHQAAPRRGANLSLAGDGDGVGWSLVPSSHRINMGRSSLWRDWAQDAGEDSSVGSRIRESGHADSQGACSRGNLQQQPRRNSSWDEDLGCPRFCPSQLILPGEAARDPRLGRRQAALEECGATGRIADEQRRQAHGR